MVGKHFLPIAAATDRNDKSRTAPHPLLAVGRNGAGSFHHPGSGWTGRTLSFGEAPDRRLLAEAGMKRTEKWLAGDDGKEPACLGGRSRVR